MAPHSAHTHARAPSAFSLHPGCSRFPFLIWLQEDLKGHEIKLSEELGMEYKIRSLDLNFVSKVPFTSCMTVGKSVKFFQGKVHSSQTRAHLKVLMNQESHPEKLFSAELAESIPPLQIYQNYCWPLLEFWLPYFHLNCEFISTMTYSFVSWVLTLMSVASHSLTMHKIIWKKSHDFFFNIG